jgi:hypothetical protein
MFIENEEFVDIIEVRDPFMVGDVPLSNPKGGSWIISASYDKKRHLSILKAQHEDVEIAFWKPNIRYSHLGRSIEITPMYSVSVIPRTDKTEVNVYRKNGEEIGFIALVSPQSGEFEEG